MGINKPYEIETISRDELEEKTNQKLSNTLKSAYDHTLFWRRKFDTLNLRPEDIKNKDDLLEAYKTGLTITKEDLIKEFRMLIPDYVQEIYTEQLWTSGFGGIPTIIPYTGSDLKKSNDQGILPFNAMGIRQKDRVLSLFANPPFASGTLSREALKLLDVYLLWLGTTFPPQPLLSSIKNFKPMCLMGLATGVYQLPVIFQEYGIDTKTLGIEKIAVSGEPSTRERRNKIAEEWGAEVYDWYASSECSIMAFECDKREGMHVAENRLLLTFIDSETKEEVGKDGIDLVTNLYEIGEKPGIFLINYSHGDRSRVISYEKCGCGRTFKRIENPTREDEVVSLAGAKLNIRDVESLISDSELFTGEYLGIFKFDEEARKPYLEVRLETKTPIPESMMPKVKKDVVDSLFKSNPSAIGIIYSQATLNVNPVEAGRLYEGVEVRPGKPRRLIRM